MDSSRIERTISSEDSFVNRVFSEAERTNAPADGQERLNWFAGRFAVKEAVFKALRSEADKVTFSEIETLRNESGAPFVTLYGQTKIIAEEAGVVTIHVSLANEKGLMIAFVVAEII